MSADTLFPPPPPTLRERIIDRLRDPRVSCFLWTAESIEDDEPGADEKHNIALEWSAGRIADAVLEVIAPNGIVSTVERMKAASDDGHRYLPDADACSCGWQPTTAADDWVLHLQSVSASQESE